MGKNTVDIANALLAEKAALEARVKELEDQLSGEKIARERPKDALRDAGQELARLKAQEPVAWRFRRVMPYMRNADGTMGWKLPWKLTENKELATGSKEHEAVPLYTEQRPAVLPPKPEWRDYYANGDLLHLTTERLGDFSNGADWMYEKLKSLGCQPQAVPEGWGACSPEWIERNGSCSCAEAPRIAFGNAGPHYHPAVFDGGKPQRFFVKLDPAWWVTQGGEEFLVYPKDKVIAAIKAAGGKVAGRLQSEAD